MNIQPSTEIPFSDPPEGTVTFLFTDIEGSTQLLHHLGDKYAILLADHHRILREAFTYWDGHEVDTQGDAFFVSFSRATQAVSAAAEAQRKLAEHIWPERVALRVRMGIHTGEPWSGTEGYVGIDVHRAARVAHVASGGQVLLSETTAALVQDELPHGVTLLDLGRHLLKDIHRPERIHQLVIEGLQAEFPPLTSLEILPPESARPPRKVGTCPFRGLSAFQEADAQFYFGREAFIDALEQAVTNKKLVAVILGSSGSGKSSAIFAGLLPRLRKAGGYQFATFRPGTQPFYSLSDVVIELLEPSLSKMDHLTETSKLAEQLAHGKEVHLAQVLERIRKDSPGTSQVLLVIDQFEELYTLCSEEGLQKAFIDELLATVETSKAKHSGLAVILLTMRADFMGQALLHRPFADALQEATILMGPMTRQELHTAIEKPAEMQGAAFEPGLVERILDDVGEKPGNLPLLEFTLTQLWERQTDGWLTHADYEAMGCVDGALAAYADHVFAGLEPAEQELARHAFVQLVQPGEGTEDTRRIATHAELGDESWSLIQHLADQRLVVTGRDAQGHETVEVVHEALIQKWGRFPEWMDTDRAFRLWQEHLRANLRQWQESGHDEATLLAGAPLAVAQSWLAERAGELNPAETGYIQASQTLQAKQQKERQRRRRWTIMGLSAGLVIAIILAAFALVQRQSARMQAAILLGSQAEAELARGNSDRAILLALADLENYPYTPQAEHALGQAVTYNRALAQFVGHTAAVTGAAWSSDGKTIATSSTDNSVLVWDATTGKLIRKIDLPTGITHHIYDWGLAVQWTPDDLYLLTMSGDRFLTGSQDADLILWNVETGQKVKSVEIQNSTPPSAGSIGTTGAHFTTGASLTVANDGRVATVGGDNTALIWNPLLEGQPMKLTGHDQAVNSVAWSPDDAHIATASEDGTARIWDAKNKKELLQLEGHIGAVNQAAWSPAENLLATAGDDGTVRIWNGTTGEQLTVLEIAASGETRTASERIVWTLAWSPDGNYLASGSGDGTIRVWDIKTSARIIEVKGHEQMVSYVAWSPIGDRLISASVDGRARVWNVKADTMQFSLPYGAAYAEWSPDGKHIAVANSNSSGGFSDSPSSTGLIAVWDFTTTQPVFETYADKDKSWQWSFLEYSPDGKYILSRTGLKWPDTTDANKYYLFDSISGEIVRKLDTYTDTLLLLPGWSPDGQLVGGGDFKGNFFFWRVSSGELLKTIKCLSWAHIVQWSPDGKKIAMLCFDYEAGRNIIQVLDAKSYEPLLIIEGDYEAETYNWFRWSPDSTRIAVACGNDETGTITNPVIVYDAANGKILLKIIRHTGSVGSVSWSPDGKRLVSSSSDDTTRIWDAQTGAELLTLPTPTDWTPQPRWSPDGKYMLVSIVNAFSPGKSGVWLVWQSTQELIDYAKECCVFRELTDAERAQFGLP